MRIAGSYRYFLHPSEKRTLAQMANDVVDGEISDGESLEEITAEDFRHGARGSTSRVLVPDPSYPLSRNFASDTYSLKCEQSVRNNVKSVGSPAKRVGPQSVKEEPFVVVIEDSSDDSESEVEKVEGELEERENELGSESVSGGTIESEESEVKDHPIESEESEVKESGEVESEEKQLEEMGELDKPVNPILEDLAKITMEEVETSFDVVCSRLRKSFEISKQNFSECRVTIVGSLVQQAFMGIQTVHSVVTSGNLMKMEQNELLLLRLLDHIKNQHSAALIPEQLKEIDAMMQYWASDNDVEGLHCGSGGNMNGISSHCSISSEKPCMEPTGVNSVVSNGGKTGLPKLMSSNSMPPKNVETGDDTFCSYDTHAFRAVSSYQQKHGRTSLLASNRLPSPTPSMECDDNDDAYGEVSSPSIVDNARIVSSARSLQLLGHRCSVPSTASSDGLQMAPSKSVGHLGLGPDSSTKALAKSRDPRLRILNSESGGIPDPYRPPMTVDSYDPNGLAGGLTDSRKHKAVDDMLADNLLKRQRNGFKGSGDVPTADSARDATLFSSANRLTKTVSSANVAPLMSSEVEQNPAGKPQLPSPTASMNLQNDVRVHMKPRDPRRILHSSRVQKRESFKSEPTRKNGNLLSDPLSIKEHFIVREQVEQAQTASLPYHPTPQPGISRLFTKNLSNAADMISSSRLNSTPPAVPQNPPQLIPSKISKVDVKSSAADSNGQNTASVLLYERGTRGASPAPTSCEEVDLLLDGYDVKERAAIQKERTRRIEEQNKMFAARKLCLVLDLDHTLLNSAMFVDVDPTHDEMLRKKEEKDRKRPQRHLFRFQHMGMWTKLRPGIWNFLERASKLYELHLSTMGNKSYATEISKLIDPTGTLFAGRVISRGDATDSFDGDERVPKIKDLDGVLGMESAVVIIDDSLRVWPHNKLNLIVVERYTYFPCSRRQFGLLGPSLLEIGRDERPEDGTLASSLAVIERIHHNFFSNCSLDNLDVRIMLAAEQRKILSGCRIVFSRIFPIGEAKPHRHPLWKTAQQFGAVCTNKIDERVTHVVANSPGTDKVNWAMSNGRFVVKPGWVEASALLYRRASEHDFAIKL